MNTRESIVDLADNYIRDKGFNAFSYHELARVIGIKTASIHYHFPTKSDLGIAIIRKHKNQLEALKTELEHKNPSIKLNGFLSIYDKLRVDDKVCLVGSLATDLNTVDDAMRNELISLAEEILQWVTDILAEGKKSGVFYFSDTPRARALMVITNMMAIVQLSRLTDNSDFERVKKSIVKDLKTEK